MNKFIISSADIIPEGADIIPGAYMDGEIIAKLVAADCTRPIFYVHNMEVYATCMKSHKLFKILYNYN